MRFERQMRFPALAGLLCLALAVTSCAHYNVQRERKVDELQARRKVWVKTNFDDNRSMALRLVEAFRARGFEVDSGPLTMMSRDYQAVVEYRDVWSWDFREHLVGLELKLLDPKTSALLARATYEDPVSLFNDPSAAAERMIDQLYRDAAAKKDVATAR